MTREKMEFPNTFDEFIKAYGFKDKKEVYTNGLELISVFRVKQWLDHIKPCEDCVSRQAALKAFEELPHEYKTKEQRARTGGIAACQFIVRELPSVTPKQRTGHWITQWNVVHQTEYYYCSECREEFSYDGETGIKMNDYDFCPHCGAKLEGVRE